MYLQFEPVANSEAAPRPSGLRTELQDGFGRHTGVYQTLHDGR